MTGRRGVGDFFAELKRRKVYRAAVFYVVAAAGLVEIVDIVVPYTRLPQDAAGVVFAAAVVGLPIVLIVAWVYDLADGRIRRTAPQASPEPPALEPDADGSPPRDESPRSLAILPFENLSQTEAVSALTSGLHGDLLTTLAKVPDLTVISRRSVMAFQDTDRPPASIGRELRVDTILEGAVQSAGGRIRLNVQLIDAASGTTRWAETYDRTLSPESIFEIQDELSRRIRDSLHVALGTAPEASGPAPGPPTADLEAYRLYARGRSWVDHRSEEALGRAYGVFREALQRDPEYALAWAGLAEALTLCQWYDYPVPDDAPDPADAARRALTLDPDLAEAHTSLGILHALRHDAAAARDALATATALGPGDAEAFIWLSWIHLVMGRPGPALPPALRALELNPLSPVVQVFAAEALLANGRLDEARERSRRAVRLQDDFALAHYMDALVAFHSGSHDDVHDGLLRALERARPGTGSPRTSEVQGLLGLVHAVRGEHREARQRLADVRSAGDAASEGIVLAALGEPGAALEAFARVDRWRAIVTEQVRFFFPDVLDPVRQDPRFDAVLLRIDRSWHVPDP